jgi:glucose-6-phosphate dehydrogenase assembly protein OpcA
MNLVVVAATPEQAERWVPIVDDVIQAVPARAIVVSLDPDAEDGLEADTSAVCTPAVGGGPSICSERVTLRTRGALCARLSSCVDTISSTDVPTTVVWLGRVHTDDRAFAPLARDANRIVLDAAQGSLTSLAHVVAWTRQRKPGERPGVADLAWTRLAPWQEMTARLFDGPRLRPLAARIERATIVQASKAGAPLGAEGALLLGWLATRLGWKAGSIAGKLRLVRPDDEVIVHSHLRADSSSKASPGSLVSVVLEASAEDIAMRGSVTRSTDDDAAIWNLEVATRGDTQRIEQRVRLLSADHARLLERTLHRPPHDEALAEAATWADELRGEELACV